MLGTSLDVKVAETGIHGCRSLGLCENTCVLNGRLQKVHVHKLVRGEQRMELQADGWGAG